MEILKKINNQKSKILKKINNQKSKIFRLDRIIILLVIIIIINVFLSTAKYKTEIEGETTAKVATPIILLSEKILQLDDLKPGFNKSYDFNVASTNGSKVTDVTLEYTLKIDTYNNLPLQMILYKYDENDQLIEENILKENHKTEPRQISFQRNTGEVHKYRLDVTWNETENDYKYSFETEYIEIAVDSHQVD